MLSLIGLSTTPYLSRTELLGKKVILASFSDKFEVLDRAEPDARVHLLLAYTLVAEMARGQIYINRSISLSRSVRSDSHLLIDCPSLQFSPFPPSASLTHPGRFLFLHS